MSATRPADPFAAIQGDRPKVTKGLTILLAGLDDRSQVPLTGTSAEKDPQGRADSVMFLRIPADRSSASIVSLPRDSWVPVPDHGYAKLNAAFALGGPSLLIQTVEKLTALHIDHLAFVDWDGFRALDAPKVGAHVSFVTAPIDGFKTIGGQSVVMLDQKKVPPFFAALAKDQLASYLSPSPSPMPSRST